MNFSNNYRILSIVLTLLVIGAPEQAIAKKVARKPLVISKQTTESQAIRNLINVIDRKSIRINCKVSEIDKIFGTTYRKKSNKEKLTNEIIDITKLCTYNSSSIAYDSYSNRRCGNWFFGFGCNKSGLINRYYLSNGSVKFCWPTSLVSGFEPPTEKDVQLLGEHYKKAIDEKGKLSVCIEAMNRGLIYTGMPSNWISKIFGPDCPDEELISGKYSILFSTKEDTWRFGFVCINEQVTTYQITNIKMYE